MNPAATLRSTPNERATALIRTFSVLILWFFLALWLGVRGALGTQGGPPIGLGLAIGVPLLLFALDRRLGQPLFGGFAQLDLVSLTAAQTFRVGGALFLVAWANGTLPGAFALPAGLGDIAIGIAAPFVAAAVAARGPRARALVIAFNVVGLVDLVDAVAMGVTHASSSFGILHGAVTTDALARYPFSLIPTFFVPIAVMLHASSLGRLSAKS
jgi:hypothetical protein